MTDQVRRDVLLRATLDVLAAAGRPVPAGDVVARIAELVDLTPWEQSRNMSGAARYSTFVRFAAVAMTKVGWLDRSRAGWLLTETGAQARDDHTPQQLYVELNRLYRQRSGAGPEPNPLDVDGDQSARAWLVRGSAVSGVNVVPRWLSEGFVSLAAAHLRPVEPGVELDELRAVVEVDYAHLSYQLRKAKVAELHAFLTRMAPGDAVVTTSEGRAYVGRIEDDPVPPADDDAITTLRRPVRWNPDGIAFPDLPDTVQARLKSSSVVVDLTEVVDAVEALLADEPEAPPPPATLPDLADDVAEQLLVDRAWLDEFVDLLRERRQVILHGPPGTGKTYLALTVAEALTDPSNVRLVQFHPSYSYEDFFEGYRPTPPDDSGRIGFALSSGPLREIVDDAEQNPGVPYVLVIDEINRANLAKVFGELYFLLEYRDRSVRLMYAADRNAPEFRLPKNVYVVGTMNTADRSIALVDTAMRRRFAFLSLHPDDEHVRGVLRAWLTARDMPVHAADLLDALNERIPDRDLKVGPSYLMRPDAGTDEGLARIWRTSILPLLVELHVGDPAVDVEQRYGLATLRGSLPATPAEDGPVPDGGT